MVTTNKHIERDSRDSTKIFDDRSLEADYSTLIPVLKEGLNVLDVGCGTGAISRGIAAYVGPTGRVTGIDNTAAFIESGKSSYADVLNLKLIHADLFEFEAEEKFDLIVSARTLQWLGNPKEALLKFKAMLAPGGMVSVLDYNHEALTWQPEPPESMRTFYSAFLQWRADAGMNNRIADDLQRLFEETGFQAVEVLKADETYKSENNNFIARAGIWSKVAAMKQISDEGYIDNQTRLQAIEDYNNWITTEATMMIMRLNDVRGRV
jgi:ubiquinone/menaquinone biosynthesis C-methylase UbiE